MNKEQDENHRLFKPWGLLSAPQSQHGIINIQNPFRLIAVAPININADKCTITENTCEVQTAKPCIEHKDERYESTLVHRQTSVTFTAVHKVLIAGEI